MFQYNQRIIQPTIRMPVQTQQSIIIPLDKSSQLQSTRRVSQNIDQQISNVSPLRLVSNKVPVSPNVIKYSQQPQNVAITPQKIPYNQRLNQTPTKQQNLQQKTPTKNPQSQQRQGMSNNQNIQQNRVQTDTCFSTPLHNQREKENQEYSNDKLTIQYQNLQEQLIQSEFKISQLEQKSRQLQEQRKKLQQQFLQKSPKLASQI